MSTIYSYTALTAFLLIVFFITDFKFKKILFNHYIIIISVGLIVRLLALKINTNFQSDVNCFVGWSNRLFEHGFSKFYVPLTPDEKPFTDYPPGYMYVLYLLGLFRAVFKLEGATYANLIKMPAILMDIATGILIYKVSLKKIKPNLGLSLTMVYLLNPAIIIDSAVWGQVDSVYTFVILLSVYLITEEKHIYAFALFAFGILIKPQVLIFSPIYLFTFYKDLTTNKFNKDTIKYWAYVVALCLFIIIIGILPFANNFSIEPVIAQYIRTLKSYPYASVNAYNFYSFIGANWKPISQNFIYLPFSIWGTIFIILIVIYSFYFLNKNFSKANCFFIAAFINTGTFMFSVKMHERYLFPSLVLFLVAYIYNRKKIFLVLFSVFSITFFINCVDILHVYSKTPIDLSVVKESLSVISSINVILFFYMLYASFSLMLKTKDHACVDIDNSAYIAKTRIINPITCIEASTQNKKMSKLDYYL